LTEILVDRSICFTQISEQLSARGYAIIDKALPQPLIAALRDELRQHVEGGALKAAKIGRAMAKTLRSDIRGDSIQWLDGDTSAQAEWLAWAAALQQSLNRQLFLGLHSFESHFAHYPVGAFYQKHFDAFVGQQNRILSVVLYLNDDWPKEAGGELLLYHSAQALLASTESGEVDKKPVVSIERVLPEGGRIVVFMSEEFPHEVMLTTRDRYSIAAWFRLANSSVDTIVST
jgi:SM-20-related protein